MKVSLNWIRKLTDIPVGIDQLIELIGAQLGAVDEVIDLGVKYKGAVIVRVVAVKKHPEADRLNICLIDDGNAVHGVPRNEHGLIQVICGAPNVQIEMLAVWLPPGMTVPETYGSAEPFVLGARTMRGQVSQGMLASQRELDLGDAHDGIVHVDEPARPGETFADTYELNDYIIDIENKMFTHRPDLFGMLGIAREVAAITGQAFHSPKWYTEIGENPLAQEARSKTFVVENHVPELVPRYMAVVLEGVSVRPSPLLFQSYLVRVGIKPINNVVDVTNYIMLLTGQPMHAYDYNSLRAIDSADNSAVLLQARSPMEGEEVALLTGKVITPGPQAVVISTAKAAVGLGGIMGGLFAEVVPDTTAIVLESATFDMYATRRTAMEHGLFTEAVTRYTKGQSPLQNPYVMVKAVEIIKGMAGGLVASMLHDDRHLDGLVANNDMVHQPIKMDAAFINARLGTTFGVDDIIKMLTNVEFTVDQVTTGVLMICAPFWRTDIEHPEDVVEEIGRLYGFSRLPLKLPSRDLTPILPNKQLRLRQQVRSVLSATGANETLNYTFVHGDMLQKAGQSLEDAFILSNALSPALQFYRLSLTPGLLQAVHPNIKAGNGCFGLFELGRVHNKRLLDEESLPVSTEVIAYVFAADQKSAASHFGGAGYYQARHSLNELLEAFHLANVVTYEPLTTTTDLEPVMASMVMPYDPVRSLLLKHNEQYIGIIGEYAPSVRGAFKLPAFTAGFEFDLSLLHQGHTDPVYERLARFPAVQQDITFKVPAAMPYAKLYGYVHDHIFRHRPKHATFSLEAADIYQPESDPASKHISLRLRMVSNERTLTAKEVELLLSHTAEAALTDLKAERV